MDNLELLRGLPDDFIDLIYSDILYNTGRKFADFEDDLGTHEEAIKCIEEATRKMPTKIVRTQADIDEFYED